MLDFATKVDNSGDALSAVEFNNYIGELENCVTSAGLTLDTDPEVITQLAQAIPILAVGGTDGFKVKTAAADSTPEFLGAKLTSTNGSVNFVAGIGVGSVGFVSAEIEPVAEANAIGGLVNDKAMTPLRTQQFDQARKFVGTSLPVTTGDEIGTVYYIYV